jgi:hypothetical protein
VLRNWRATNLNEIIRGSSNPRTAIKAGDNDDKTSKATSLALLAASFAFCGSFAYADTEETTSIQVLNFDAVGNPGEIIAALDCDSEDGISVAASPASCPPSATPRALARSRPSPVRAR